jgi:hypothetical protein
MKTMSTVIALEQATGSKIMSGGRAAIEMKMHHRLPNYTIRTMQCTFLHGHQQQSEVYPQTAHSPSTINYFVP